MHRYLKRFFAALAVVVALSPAAFADAATRQAGFYGRATVDATAGSTFATTSYADLAAATTSLTPSVDPNAATTAGNLNVDTIIVEWSADVSKATATTGTCGVFVNGALLAKTARSIASAAGQGTIGGVFYIPNTTTGAQTVKLQCKSGDTNVFTVNNAQMTVTEAY